MLVTEGIILRTIKYGETSLIMDLYTREKGLISCIAGGVRKKRTRLHASSFQLLQINRVNLYYQKDDKLSRIKDVQPAVILDALSEHPIKRVIILFMAELLQKSIKEKEDNADLYDFLHRSICLLNDSKESVANFHLVFMVRLSAYLGFKPIHDYDIDKTFFDLKEGCFVSSPNAGYTLSGEQSALISSILSTSLETSSQLLLNATRRRTILDGLIRYFQYHVDGFGIMKSPDIIHVVLS